MSFQIPDCWLNVDDLWKRMFDETEEEELPGGVDSSFAILYRRRRPGPSRYKSLAELNRSADRRRRGVPVDGGDGDAEH